MRLFNCIFTIIFILSINNAAQATSKNIAFNEGGEGLLLDEQNAQYGQSVVHMPSNIFRGIPSIVPKVIKSFLCEGLKDAKKPTEFADNLESFAKDLCMDLKDINDEDSNAIYRQCLRKVVDALELLLKACFLVPVGSSGG